MRSIISTFLFFLLICISIPAQDYYLESYQPFDAKIPSPEQFLGYPIGDHHTRHDRIVSYFETLAALSDRASLETYGQTYGHRPLIMLTVTSENHLSQIDQLREQHLKYIDPLLSAADLPMLPIFVNLGYNVHGNEPSGAEAALLTAYILVASEHEDVKKYRENGIYFIDPVINPDGRDRHTHWANMYKADPLVDDPLDVEHNEAWPRGRTNHYWFDLNRDWWLAIHPESRGKLKWYHQWYPNVVTDFHEMGTNSTHFFEPMKTNGSLDPVMPEENYTTLNDTFARYFTEALDAIGSLYFAKEVFDGTYPGYGSSYPDLKGGLGLLFEQASSRGHAQKNDFGTLTFAFTIRNQLTSAMATVKAAVEQKDLLYGYMHDFFSSAMAKSQAGSVANYVFGDQADPARIEAFIDKLLLHKIKVFKNAEAVIVQGVRLDAGKAFVVPTEQPQYRMVQNVFETYDEYADSVFYDASAWSLINFYGIPYEAINQSIPTGEEINDLNDLAHSVEEPQKTSYAYLVPYENYQVFKFLHTLIEKEIKVFSAFKPFTANIGGDPVDFGYGTLMIPVASQEISADDLHQLLTELSREMRLGIHPVSTGYSINGVDLGSRYFNRIEKPKVLLLIGEGVSSYEAGEVWHLMDQRVGMPITKVPMRQFDRIPWHKYNTLVMVSGGYQQLDSSDRQKISDWLSQGNTLITSRQASAWVIKNKMVKHELVKWKDPQDTVAQRNAYVNSREEIGREAVGGAIFSVDLDLTHPLAFGYTKGTLPVYRNSTVWLQPSKNKYCTVAQYSKDPHIDGFITSRNLEHFLKPGASLVVEGIGQGRVVLFAENPNFRGSWYGTNRLFLNGIFLGSHIQIPRPR